VYVLELSDVSALPQPLRLNSPRFVCLVAWDAANATQGHLGTLAQQLLDAGAVWICCWGKDCERVHDTIDEVFAVRSDNPEVGGAVMTTWHDHENLAEVIEFSLQMRAAYGESQAFLDARPDE
jgi:hypothetical protein